MDLDLDTLRIACDYAKERGATDAGEPRPPLCHLKGEFGVDQVWLLHDELPCHLVDTNQGRVLAFELAAIDTVLAFCGLDKDADSYRVIIEE